LNWSRRSGEPAATNRWSDAVAERRRSGLTFIDLTISNPTVVGLGPDWTEIAAALAAREGSRYAPHPLGSPSARAAVAAHLGAVADTQVVVSSSTSEAYSWIFKLLCDDGDDVLVPAPCYPLFAWLTALEGVRVVHYPVAFAGGEWWVDRAALVASIGPRTRAVISVSPANPTGALLREGDCAAIEALCAARGMAHVVDEVFADSTGACDAPPADAVTRASGRSNCLTFALGGLSKTCLLPQIKAAWIAVSGPAGDVAAALARLEVIADTWLSPSAPAQQVVAALLPRASAIQRPLRDRIARNAWRLRSCAAGSPITVLPIEGGWSAVLRAPALASDEAVGVTLARDHGLAVQPGYLFDFAGDGHFVVSLITPPEVIADAAPRLISALADASSEARDA